MHKFLKWAAIAAAGLLVIAVVLAVLAGRLSERKRTRVSPVVPFESPRNLSDVDVGAVYAHLKTLPARPAGGR